MGRLELLAYGYPSENSDSPSWVADWSASDKRLTVVPPAANFATGMSRASFCEAGIGELEVSGILHGVVTSTFPELYAEQGKSVRTWLQSLEERYVTDDTYPTGENMNQAFARMLVSNRLVEQTVKGSWEGMRLADWEGTLDRLIHGEKSDLPKDTIMESVPGHELATWRKQNIFQIEHGYLEHGPLSMREGDGVCFLLGLYCPLIIRAVGNDRFQIIGGCYVYGLMDSETLLGPLPDHHIAQKNAEGNRFLQRYYNIHTQELVVEDPRLGPLDEGWEGFDRETTADDPRYVDFFRNVHTGEEISCDPRLTETALERRGVQLQSITFV